jgi:hypothetical protein
MQMSERAGSYRQVSPLELKERVVEVYHQVGSWLLDKSETGVERRHMAIGACRVEPGVSVNELVRVLVLTKRNLWSFIDDVLSGPRRGRL